MSGYIYFLESNLGLIKIGASIKLDTRIFGLALSNAACLKLLGYIEVDKDKMLEIEKRIHIKFEGSRKHGEWFCETPELTEFIAQNSNAVCDFINDTLLEIYNSPKLFREKQLVKMRSGGSNRAKTMNGTLTPKIIKLLSDSPMQDTRCIYEKVHCSKSKCWNLLIALQKRGIVDKVSEKGTRGGPNRSVWFLAANLQETTKDFASGVLA